MTGENLLILIIDVELVFAVAAVVANPLGMADNYSLMVAGAVGGAMVRSSCRDVDQEELSPLGVPRSC